MNGTQPESLPSRLDRGQILAKSMIVVGVAVVSAGILSIRKTSRTLLRVGSFGGAVAEVVFWAAPGIVAFVVVPRRWLGLSVSTVLLGGLTVVQWWSSSIDRSSTASVGPFITGWMIVPVLLGAGGIGSWAVHRSR